MIYLEYYIVGKIVNTHGLKGELKVENRSDFDRFEKNKEMFIEKSGSLLKVKIKAVREAKGMLLVQFEGLEDINLVEKYKGCLLKIDEDSLEELEENEYYYRDLIGLKVYNQDNVFRGTVNDIIEYPQSDYLEIILEDGKKKLIPFINEFIESVSDKIIIKEIEGLL